MEITGNYCRRIKSWVEALLSSHEAVADAHHAKYTNTEAVDAVAAADVYVKNIGDIVNGALSVIKTTGNLALYVEAVARPVLRMQRNVLFSGLCAAFDLAVYKTDGNANVNDFSGGLTFSTKDLNHSIKYVSGVYGGLNGSWNDGKLGILLRVADSTAIHYEFTGNSFDVMGKPIKDIKNHAASALSGTKKLVEIDIGGTPYYFEVSPTKA